MTIRSMTGFARVQADSARGEVTVTVKTVNHRGLDIHFQMPVELDVFESSLRAVVKRSLVRGHVQVAIGLSRLQASPGTLNRELLEAYVAAFRTAAEAMGVAGEPDLNAALGLPGMFRAGAPGEPDQETGQLLVSALEQAMQALNSFREREGAELALDMLQRTSAIQDAAGRVESLRAKALPAYQARLSERLSELLGTAAIEPVRLMQEAAILADRSDVSEELTRLQVHAGQLEGMLKAGGEVGKKIDFLLQEMGRETNTILSKTNGIGDSGLAISDLALAIKAEIEKIREQSLNLE
jgi:uncharacterized protein (TIGR00255 family)